MADETIVLHPQGPLKRLIYAAFVSHGDEGNLEFLPLGTGRTPQDCDKLCRLHAAENEDQIERWDWETTDHSRIAGEFWDVEVMNQNNETFKYYIRPLELLIADGHLVVELLDSQPRKRQPLLAHCRDIKRVYEARQPQLSKKQLAWELSMSEPSLAQHLAIADLPDRLRGKLPGEVAAAMIDELERRLDLDPDHGLAIPFAHARELRTLLRSLPPDSLLVALRVLVRFVDNQPTTQPPPDYPMFRALIAELLKT